MVDISVKWLRPAPGQNLAIRIFATGLLGAILAVSPGQISRASTPENIVPALNEELGSRLTKIVDTLRQKSVAILDGDGQVVASKAAGSGTPALVREADVVKLLRSGTPGPKLVIELWDVFADLENSSLLRLPIIQALLAATTSPEMREAMWSELAGLQRTRAAKKTLEFSLLEFFERHGAVLRQGFGERRETETSGEEMLVLMAGSKIFGTSFKESLAWIGRHNPGALARRIEHERGTGRPVSWEDAAFEHMLAWKRDQLGRGTPNVIKSIDDWDQFGETFALIFNSLHGLDERYRKRMLEGVDPVAVFNVVVGGEFELYRMGTSSYRDHLHEVFMNGLKNAGSFEAFLTHAGKSWADGTVEAAALSRGMVALRVASSFGNLDDVLMTVRDAESFIDHAIHALTDTKNLERNALVILDLLTSTASSAAATGFRQALSDTLYKSFDTESDEWLRNVYGSVLSVYQTVTGSRKNRAIDAEFPIDDAVFRVPFGKLYTPDGRNRFVHRMFMRLDEDTDASAVYSSFRTLARSRGASHRQSRHHEMYRFASAGRAIEIYLNKPTTQGTTRGVGDIAAELRGKRVETVIGRGHSGIIKPLKESSKRVLGDMIGDVSLVLVGTCGGDASIPGLVDTFGYVSFVATRSTGRQVINNAIMEEYIDALLALKPGRRLALADVLDAATRRFLSRRGDGYLRDDAAFYGLSAKRVLLAQLLDRHVPKAVPQAQHAAR